MDARDAGLANPFLLEALATSVGHGDGIAFDTKSARLRVLKGVRSPESVSSFPRSSKAPTFTCASTRFLGIRCPLVRRCAGWHLCFEGSRRSPSAATRARQVLAEKLATAVEFGADNTRLRDYFDIWFLIGRYAFQGSVLAAAIDATFASRDAHQFLDGEERYWARAFAPEYATPSREMAWRHWVGMHAPASDAPCLQATVGSVARFAMPLLIAARNRRIAPRSWDPRVGWTNRGRWTAPAASAGKCDIGILQENTDVTVELPMLKVR